MTKNPKRMSETAAILRQINVNDVNNDLNVDEQTTKLTIEKYIAYNIKSKKIRYFKMFF